MPRSRPSTRRASAGPVARRRDHHEEVAEGLETIAWLKGTQHLAVREAMKYWCLTLFNLNEFAFLD